MPLAVWAALLAGCASADFELGAEAVEDTAFDAVALESAIVEDSGDASQTDTCAANACGGCGALAAPPGMPCGICGTSAYACTGMTGTACRAPDDRTDGAHIVNKGADRIAVLIAVSGGAAIPLRMPRAGSLTSVSLSLERADLNGTAAPGSLRVRVIRGAPSLTPALADVLAAVSIAAASIPTMHGVVTIAFPGGLPILAKDEPMWIELEGISERSQFGVYGASSGGEPQVLERTTTGYVRTSSVNAYVTLGIRACW